MHVAIGYRWTMTSVGHHLERALIEQGHQVTYVGLPAGERCGYDSSVSLPEVISAMPQKPSRYVWIDPSGRYFPKGIEEVPILTACYLVDVYRGTWREQAARFFDVVFIAQKDYLSSFRQAVGHDQVYWLPLAAAADVHYQKDLPRIYDVGFVGNLSLAHRRSSRARRLRLISSHFETNDFYRAYSPEEVGEVYSQSRIVFNTSIAGDVTMRVFEGAACGALMITDSVSNGLPELFSVGREIVIFEDDADLLEKIAYYLENEEERLAIAEKGRLHVQREHTYSHRVQQMIGVVGGKDIALSAPMRQADEGRRRVGREIVYTHLHMLDALLDEARTAGYGPLRRLWIVLPCLIRRLLIRG